MRFATIASLFLSALSISAEITETDATAANELLVELTKLPTCAVSIKGGKHVHAVQLTTKPDYLRDNITSNIALCSRRFRLFV
jgi:hypothetical protein